MGRRAARRRNVERMRRPNSLNVFATRPGHDDLFPMIRLNNQIDCRFQFVRKIVIGIFKVRHYVAS
jgi:hypothetical protein